MNQKLNSFISCFIFIFLFSCKSYRELDFQCGTNNKTSAHAKLTTEKESRNDFNSLVWGSIISESTNEPIPLASVKIIGGEVIFKSVDSNLDGKFEFEITPGEYTLEIQLPALDDTLIIEKLTFYEHSINQMEILVQNY